MGKVIAFSHDYSKLHKKTFSTIRRRDKGFEPGDVVWIRGVNGWMGQARILLKHKKSLRELNTEFLLQDTDCTTRQEAIALLQSFYKKPLLIDEKLTIYYLVWETIYSQNPHFFRIWKDSNKISKKLSNTKMTFGRLIE